MIQRFITAFSLLGIGCFVITLGGLYMWLWVFLVATASLYEMFGMLETKYTIHYGYKILGFIAVLVTMITAYIPQTNEVWLSVPIQTLSCLGLIACMGELLTKKPYFPQSAQLASIRLIGFCALFFPYIYLLRASENGLIYFFFVLITIWTCDSFALFGGKLFGKRQLTDISPQKTVEGTIVGITCGMILAVIMISLFHLPLLKFLIIALIVCILSQLGDLHESLIKRFFNTKDSSQLLPGHGGFYDRVDSTLFVCPIAFYLLNGIL